jgi:hypothetical protein
MKFAIAHNNGAEDILCPCRNCRNGVRRPIDIVRCHVNVTGMLRTYTRWIYHGESGHHGGNCCPANDDGHESDDSDDFDPYEQSVFDKLGALVEDMASIAGKNEMHLMGLTFLRSSTKKR